MASLGVCREVPKLRLNRDARTAELREALGDLARKLRYGEPAQRRTPLLGVSHGSIQSLIRVILFKRFNHSLIHLLYHVRQIEDSRIVVNG